jgi:hypothetical protein
MPDKLLVVTVTPTGDATWSNVQIERAVRAFGEALNQARAGTRHAAASVAFGWEPALPRPGSVLAALVTVLTDRDHDPTVIAERIGQVNEDELWWCYLGPAADRLEDLLGLAADPGEALR